MRTPILVALFAAFALLSQACTYTEPAEAATQQRSRLDIPAVVQWSPLASASFGDTSPKTLFTVPPGEQWFVQAVQVKHVVAWDGTGADIDIGVSGGDVDGYHDGSAHDVTDDATVFGLAQDEAGALLWDAGNTHGIVSALAGGSAIIATITPGSTPTTGTTAFRLQYARITSTDR